MDTLASDPAARVALVTLIAMEVVLGIDNLVGIFEPAATRRA